MSVSDSKFNMWRTVTALAHSDGVFHRDEEDYLKKIFENINLSKEQRDILAADLETAQDPAKLHGLITEPGDRAQVTYFGRILLWADKDFDHTEEEILSKLMELSMNKVDFKEALIKVNQISEDSRIKEELRKENRPFHRKVLDAIVFWEDLP
jgi:uncharacterized membrane protein YebE (DUF533 family)